MSEKKRIPLAISSGLDDYYACVELINAIRVRSGLPEFTDEQVVEMKKEWDREQIRLKEALAADAEQARLQEAAETC